MLSRLYKWLAGVLALLALFVGIYFKGRSSGKSVENAKRLELDLKQEQRRNEVVSTAKQVNSEVSDMSSSDVQQRLRDKYTRD